MRLRLAFYLSENDRLTVSCEAAPANPSAKSLPAAETRYDDVDLFLKLLIFADLEESLTRQLVIAVVLAVAHPEQQGEWMDAEITPDQNEILGLSLPQNRKSSTGPSSPLSSLMLGAPTEYRVEPDRSVAFPDNAALFHDFLENAPSPFAMFRGSEHIIAFLNAPYLRLVGRFSQDKLLGQPIRQALPELESQLCFSLLDHVYKTGRQQVVKTMRKTLPRKSGEFPEGVCFDITYTAVRDNTGCISGVMAQANDVTEHVVARQQSVEREQRLYRLWSELETIYDAAPLGIAVIEAPDLRVLRLNPLQAGILGAPAESLVGRTLPELPSLPLDLLSLLKRAAAGESIADAPVRISAGTTAPQRGFFVNIRPAVSEVGVVETLTLISREIGVTSPALEPALAN